VPDMVTFETKS